MNIKIINYIVNEAHFKANPLPQGVTNFTIKPNIRMDIKKEARTLALSITVTVKGSETEPVPFDLDVRLTGNFAILSPAANVDELRIEASKTLYPYMRAYVATITANANIVPYSLPVIDFDNAVATATKIVPGAAVSANPAKRGVDAITIRPVDEEV